MSQIKNFLLDCIQLSINSYEGKHGKIVEILDTWEKNVVNENIEFYFGTKNGALYIVIRGSDEWKDWQQNLDTHSIDIDEGEMGLGFFEDNQRIQSLCFFKAKTFKNIIITGHSKGACQALMLYYFMKKEYPDKNIECVAIAPAKCVSKELVEYFNNVYVIMNGEDYICKIPFWKFANLKKFKKFVRIGKWNLFFKIPLFRIIGAIDHYPQKYLKNMKKYTKVIL
jgi:hypothetical protein